MALLFVSNNPDDFNNMTFSTYAGKFDSTRVPGSLYIFDDVQYTMKEQHPAASGDVTWYHFRWQGHTATGSSDDGLFAQCIDANGKFVAELDMSNGLLGIKASGDGTTWGASDLSGTGIAQTVQRRIDIKTTVTVSDVTADLYIDETLAASATISNTGTVGVPRKWNFVPVDATASGGANYVTEFIVADTDTKGMRLSMLQPTTAGDNTDWDGAVADLTDFDAQTGMTTATAADRHSMNFDTYNGTDSIVAVIPAAVISAGENAPTKANVGVRISSTDYDGSDTPITDDRSRVDHTFLLDPSDSGAWTAAKVNACQLQIEAVA